jgi:hypothetical protein
VGVGAIGVGQSGVGIGVLKTGKQKENAPDSYASASINI